MFIVFHKGMKKPFTVYAVKEIDGQVHFLVYMNDTWLFEYSSAFEPCNKDIF